MKVAENKLSSIVRACRIILQMSQSRSQLAESERLYYEMLTTYFNRVLDAHENDRFIAAHTVFFPIEILYAMDIVPMHNEVSSWMIALFTGEYSSLIEAGSEQGLASEICSPHRGLAGAFTIGALPRPNAILWTNLLCDNTAKSGELLMEINDCPGYFIDHPFQQSPREMNYLVSELQGMVDFLEEQSGNKMDWTKLGEIVARGAKQIELYREIGELRKAIPSPFRPQGFLQLLTTDYLFFGQPEAIEYLEVLRDEISKDVDAGKGAVEQENFRLMTLFTPPMYLMGFLEKISRQYGAVSVTEPFFCTWREGELNPEKPLESVAQKSFMDPVMRMYGPLDDQAVQDIISSAETYKVDGAIYYADVGCRQSCATIKLFKDALNEIDVPVLTIDCDTVDPTITSEDEIRDKLERFFELLEDR